jgi:hypothetical protein
MEDVAVRYGPTEVQRSNAAAVSMLMAPLGKSVVWALLVVSQHVAVCKDSGQSEVIRAA